MLTYFGMNFIFEEAEPHRARRGAGTSTYRTLLYTPPSAGNALEHKARVLHDTHYFSFMLHVKKVPVKIWHAERLQFAALGLVAVSDVRMNL